MTDVIIPTPKPWIQGGPWPGKGRLLCGHNIYVGSSPQNFIGSTLFVLIPMIGLIIDIIPNSLWSPRISWISLLSTGLFALIFIIWTSTRDPGLIPRAMDPTKAHKTRHISAGKYRFTLKWCRTCTIHRPLRASHCSRCDSCVMRFDHCCTWLGTDIGYRNYPHFLLLLLSVTLFTGNVTICALGSLVNTINKLLDAESSKFLDHLLGWGLDLLYLGFGGFMLFSISKLGSYHISLLKKGETTHEDMLAHFSSCPNPYDRGSFSANLKEAFRGWRAPSLLGVSHERRIQTSVSFVAPVVVKKLPAGDGDAADAAAVDGGHMKKKKGRKRRRKDKTGSRYETGQATPTTPGPGHLPSSQEMNAARQLQLYLDARGGDTPVLGESGKTSRDVELQSATASSVALPVGSTSSLYSPPEEGEHSATVREISRSRSRSRSGSKSRSPSIFDPSAEALEPPPTLYIPEPSIVGDPSIPDSDPPGDYSQGDYSLGDSHGQSRGSDIDTGIDIDRSGMLIASQITCGVADIEIHQPTAHSQSAEPSSSTSISGTSPAQSRLPLHHAGISEGSLSLREIETGAVVSQQQTIDVEQHHEGVSTPPQSSPVVEEHHNVPSPLPPAVMPSPIPIRTSTTRTISSAPRQSRGWVSMRNTTSSRTTTGATRDTLPLPIRSSQGGTQSSTKRVPVSRNTTRERSREAESPSLLSSPAMRAFDAAMARLDRTRTRTLGGSPIISRGGMSSPHLPSAHRTASSRMMPPTHGYGSGVEVSGGTRVVERSMLADRSRLIEPDSPDAMSSHLDSSIGDGLQIHTIRDLRTPIRRVASRSTVDVTSEFTPHVTKQQPYDADKPRSAQTTRPAPVTGGSSYSMYNDLHRTEPLALTLSTTPLHLVRRPRYGDSAPRYGSTHTTTSRQVNPYGPLGQYTRGMANSRSSTGVAVDDVERDDPIGRLRRLKTSLDVHSTSSPSISRRTSSSRYYGVN
eukprot:gnl/Dysnectes_brevis/3804_a4896_942.p1 GENE.gnl/Dysnectes_brevis/3804_a4896_942~~gnl/Dysnectes_brevis/3804_a4896_942.p1  ORF type:complete len:972 (+),score=106.81 gnl/Dysnectes_brevis/3804_a4896_942:76-2991(+)